MEEKMKELSEKIIRLLEEKKVQECGVSEYIGDNYCYDNDVYRDYVERGCKEGSCYSDTIRKKQQECGDLGCSEGKCVSCSCTS